MPRDSKSYALPAIIDPESYQAICVLVPSDTLYLAAFWNAYEYFTKHVAWERDALHRGTLAAQVWRAGFQISRAQWEAGERCMTQFQLRDDPDDPCKVQQSTDGGDTWSHAFDKDGCNETGGTVPPYPTGSTGAEDAAANFVTNTYIKLAELTADCTISREAFIEAATAYFRLYDPLFSQPAGLGEYYDAYCALDSGERDELADPCKYGQIYSDLKNCWGGDGLLSDVECYFTTFGEILDETWETAVSAANKVIAYLHTVGVEMLGMEKTSMQGGGFESQCDWCHTFDLTADDYAAGNPTNITQYFGAYVPGVGYQSTGGDGQVDIRFEFGSIMEISYMEFQFTASQPEHHDLETVRAATQHGTFAGFEWHLGSEWDNPVLAHMLHVGGGIIYAGHAPVLTGFVQIQIIPGCVGGCGEQTVTSWKICGVGPDPFV